MKIITAVLSVLLITNSWAQTIDGSDSLDANFAETAKLTDEQADEAATFVHQGLKDKAIKEGCDNKTLKGCDGSSAQPGLEDQIGKMYALIFGLGPMMMGGRGNNSSSSSNPAPAEGQDQGQAQGQTEGQAQSGSSKQDQKKKDYCIYIPLLYEGVSMLMQMAGQKQTQQDTQNLDPQLAALAQLKEAHKTRKKTATFQAGVYGVTTACYAALLFTPGKATPMYFVKMGAAGALAVLYKSKASKHAKAAKMVQDVIDSLPKAGDCNPWTGTSCFCSEKTSAKLYPGQYNEVCVLNKGVADGDLSSFGCAAQVNGQVTLDASCGCKATNTCLSSKISLGTSSLGMGANFVNDANKGLELLDTNGFSTAKLNDFSSAMVGKAGAIKAKDAIAEVKLTPEQKALADEMSKVAPASIANLAAASPSGAPPSGGLMSGATSASLNKLPEALKKNLKDFEVTGNYRRNGGYSPTASSAEPGFSIPGFGSPQQPQGGITVEEDFAAKAVSQADVRNTPDTAIFDIISNRYRTSAWKRLDAEEK